MTRDCHKKLEEVMERNQNEYGVSYSAFGLAILAGNVQSLFEHDVTYLFRCCSRWCIRKIVDSYSLLI